MAYAQMPQLPQAQRELVQLGGKYRAVVRPRHVRQVPEKPLKIQVIRAHQSVREQMQTQVPIDCVLRGLIQINGGGAHLSAGIAFGVLAGELFKLIREGKIGGLGERRRGEPRIQYRARIGAGGDDINEGHAGSVTSFG